MDGKRELFSCPACGKDFTYWVLAAAAQPKVKCSFCRKESFPRGEPAPQPAEAPAAEKAPAASAGA